MQDDDVFDVILVGYGPVGQTMAALLGREGHRVAVFERWPDLYGRARAGHVDHEIMRIFQSVGAAEAVEANAHLADKYVFRSGSGETLMSFDYNGAGISGWRSDYIVYQPDVEDALTTAVRARPSVEVNQGWEVTGFQQDADGVDVTVRCLQPEADGEPVLADELKTVRGRYLVAADGANSSVRSSLGIGWNDLGFQSTWLVVDLVPTGPMSFEFDNGQVCDPARPHCLFQLGKHHRRFEFAALPGEDPERLAQTEVAWELMAPYDVTPANADIERHAVYTFGSSLAERWSAGRVFLVGDAVHLMPPFMGQGMCTGIRDAANLAWRLDMVLAGTATESLLGTFETERAPHAEAIVQMSIAAGEVSCTFDPAVAAARDEAFRTGTAPPPPPFPVLEDGLLAQGADALAGHLAPQGRVRLAGRVGRFDDLIGCGWVLLSCAPVTADLGPAGRAPLDRLGARVVVVDEEMDVDGFYRDYFAGEGVAAIIYRPDFYIFGSAARPQDVASLLSQLDSRFPTGSGGAVLARTARSPADASDQHEPHHYMGARDMSQNVIVVGGGPSGLVVASELALAGVDVTVIERRTEPVQSRAGTILPRVLELLDARGLAQDFIDRARTIRSNPLFRTHMWAGMKPVEWRHLESKYGYRLILPQNVTEELLAKHALQTGVTIARGFTVESLTQDDSGVTIGMADAEGIRTTATAAYVVGCDGGRSIVRELIGVDFAGHGPTFTGIVADVVIDNPWREGRRIVDNEHGWLASFPFGTGATRFNFVHAERMHADPSEPVTIDEVRTCLREILEFEVEFDEMRWASRFSDATRIAAQFSSGRVFLVGESTRIHYPASGVGMNFCIQDAFNLGWKLAAVVNGYASPSLLSTFEAERRPVAEALLRSVASQCSVQFSFSPEAVTYKRWFESTIMPMPDVNRRLALELNGLTDPYPSAPGAGAMAGERAPDLQLQTADGIVTVGELLRSQHLLVLDLTGDDRLRNLAYQTAPVDVVSAVPVRLPDALRSATTLLIRPDAYLAWVGHDGDDESAVRCELRRWLEHGQ